MTSRARSTVVLSALLVCGCFGGHPPGNGLKRPLPVSDPETAVTVVVARNFNPLGSGLLHWIVLDERVVSHLFGLQHTAFLVEPGTRYVGVACRRGRYSGWEYTNELYTLEPGQTYGFLATPGLVDACELDPIDAEATERWIGRTEWVEPGEHPPTFQFLWW